MNETKILVVEDEVIMALALENALQSMGYVTMGNVPTGVQAIESVRKNPPDLILMDIKLEGDIDGIETVREIHKFNEIPVIYLTAYSDSDILSRAISTNPYGYLIKPYKIRELQTTIETAVNKDHAFRAERAFRLAEKERSIILNSVSEEICHIGTDCTIRWMNKKGIEAAGSPENGIMGMKCHSLWFGRDMPCEGCPCRSTLEEGIEESGHISRPDGRIYEVVCNPVFDESDAVSGAVITSREITSEIEAQKREAMALRDIEKNLEKMAVLSDHIRNPLSVIVAIADMWDCEESKNIMKQVKTIDDIITKLDEGWLASEKIREFLRRNHNFKNPD